MPLVDAIADFFRLYFGSWTSVVDILLVAFVIYWLFILIRGTRAVRISPPLVLDPEEAATGLEILAAALD